MWVRVPPSAGTFFINLATARFASISFGSPGRNAVSAVGGAHNFLRRNKPIHFFQSTTGACSQNAGLHIKLHLAQRRNIRDQSIFVQTKSFKGMPSCFYRARPILCFCSFQGMLNASLRRAGASGVRNLTPSIDGSDGDLDSVGAFVRDNTRDIGKDRSRGRKRCAEKGSARLHQSVLDAILHK